MDAAEPCTRIRNGAFLVTGGAGCIGSHLAELRGDAAVRILDKAKRRLGFFPLVDCAAGSRRTVEYFRHGAA